MNRDEAAKGVPGGVNPDLAKALVQKLGVTKIVATVEDPDSGECEMHGGNELAESFGLSEEQARAFWDSSMATVARGECKILNENGPPIPAQRTIPPIAKAVIQPQYYLVLY